MSSPGSGVRRPGIPPPRFSPKRFYSPGESLAGLKPGSGGRVLARCPGLKPGVTAQTFNSAKHSITVQANSPTATRIRGDCPDLQFRKAPDNDAGKQSNRTSHP